MWKNSSHASITIWPTRKEISIKYIAKQFRTQRWSHQSATSQGIFSLHNWQKWINNMFVCLDSYCTRMERNKPVTAKENVYFGFVFRSECFLLIRKCCVPLGEKGLATKTLHFRHTHKASQVSEPNKANLFQYFPNTLFEQNTGMP